MVTNGNKNYMKSIYGTTCVVGTYQLQQQKLVMGKGKKISAARKGVTTSTEMAAVYKEDLGTSGVKRLRAKHTSSCAPLALPLTSAEKKRRTERKVSGNQHLERVRFASKGFFTCMQLNLIMLLMSSTPPRQGLALQMTQSFRWTHFISHSLLEETQERRKKKALRVTIDLSVRARTWRSRISALLLFQRRKTCDHWKC
jgi:hypothetical protein